MGSGCVFLSGGYGGTARGEVLRSATWVSARGLVQESLYLLVCLFGFSVCLVFKFLISSKVLVSCWGLAWSQQ